MPSAASLALRRYRASTLAVALSAAALFAWCAPADGIDAPLAATVEAAAPVSTDDASVAPLHDAAALTGAPDGGAVISSVARARDGSSYVAGTFVDTLQLGAVSLTSRGESDVFLARTSGEEPRVDGGSVAELTEVAWAVAVGSLRSEGTPRVTVQDDVATVTLVGTTDGEVDCGRGKMATWSGGTFYVCIFAQRDAALIEGGTFPLHDARGPASADRP